MTKPLKETPYPARATRRTRPPINDPATWDALRRLADTTAKLEAARPGVVTALMVAGATDSPLRGGGHARGGKGSHGDPTASAATRNRPFPDAHTRDELIRLLGELVDRAQQLESLLDRSPIAPICPRCGESTAGLKPHQVAKAGHHVPACPR